MAASKFVMISIVVFDLIALGLAAAAERRRSKAVLKKDNPQEYQYCVYDSDIASGFGVGALLFLLLSQLIVLFATKCFCRGRTLRSGGSRACALFLFLLSWLTFIIAEACLLAGSVRNAYHTKYRGIWGGEPLSCQTLRRGVFAAGAAFTFFTMILTEIYYVCFSRANQSYDAPKDSGVGMAATADVE